jgi:hypothetical protein
VYSLIAAAGVGFAVYTVLWASKESTEERADILDAVESATDRLSHPAEVLYKYLQTGETPTSPEELAELAHTEGNTDFGLKEMEAQAYAILLSNLQGSSS